MIKQQQEIIPKKHLREGYRAVILLSDTKKVMWCSLLSGSIKPHVKSFPKIVSDNYIGINVDQSTLFKSKLVFLSFTLSYHFHCVCVLKKKNAFYFGFFLYSSYYPIHSTFIFKIYLFILLFFFFFVGGRKAYSRCITLTRTFQQLLGA